MRYSGKKVKCNLRTGLRKFWKIEEEGEITGELLYVGQETEDDGTLYVCAYVILEDGRVIGVDPTNLVFIKEK